jgi:hypothetical protein
MERSWATLQRWGRGRWCARRLERPVHMCDDVMEHGEGVNGTSGAKRCEHVFGKRIDVNLTLYLPCIFKWDMFNNHQLMHIIMCITWWLLRIDVVCLPVVGVEEDLKMFPGSLCSVGEGASVWIHKAHSVIYCVVRVALVWETAISRPAVTDDSISRFCPSMNNVRLSVGRTVWNRNKECPPRLTAEHVRERPIDRSVNLCGRGGG